MPDTLPPVLLNLVAGRSADFSRSTPDADGTYGGVYSGTETITATIWPEGQEVYSLQQVGSPNAWLIPSTTTWLASFTDAQTSTLTPGVYQMEVTAPVASGRTGVLFRGEIEVFASAGSVAPTNLASAYYVGKALSQIGLAPGEWEYMPDNIGAASELIRKYCNRRFSQAQYSEILAVDNQTGTIVVSEIPVQQLIRVQCNPESALTVGNATATSAWISAVATGDPGFGNSVNVTGLQLNWQAAGATTSVTVTFTTNMTISQLATAIGAVGNGWTAVADSVLGAWPVGELVDVLDGKGASTSALPDGGAIYHVYGSIIDNAQPIPDMGYKTGVIWVGDVYEGGEWLRWGPTWGGDANQRIGPGRCRATYVGGFATIPLPIQAAVAELVKANFERLKTDHQTGSETGDRYSYTLAEELVSNLPKSVRQTLSDWRISNA